jgi:hypothetical protein
VEGLASILCCGVYLPLKYFGFLLGAPKGQVYLGRRY